MARNYTFILFKTSNEEIKTIYEMATEGSRVIFRKSLGIRISAKNWDPQNKRVTSKEVNFNEINQKLRQKEELYFYENPDKVSFASDSSCAIIYMHHQLERGLADGTKKVATYNKYKTVLSGFRRVTQEKFGSNYLSFAKLRDQDAIRELTMGLSRGYGKAKKVKKPLVIFNYLSIFKSYVDHWNRYSGTDQPINTTTFFNFVQKKQQQKLAPSISREQIKKLENYEPIKIRKRTYAPQVLAKNIFLFQYYSAGIRYIDAITLTNKMIGDDKLVIPIRKTTDVISVPFYFPMLSCLKSYFPSEFDKAIQQIKLGKVVLEAQSIQQLFRIEGVDFLNLTYDGFCNLFNSISNEQMDKELTYWLSKIKHRMEDEINRVFFSMIKNLPSQFLFPQLSYDDFKDAIDGGNNFNNEQEYLIHRARTRHNNSLKRIGVNLRIEGLSGHVPRHTLANHMAYSGNSEEEIRQVLGHSNVRTTKIYLRERHGFSGSYDIMKRFHQRSDDS